MILWLKTLSLDKIIVIAMSFAHFHEARRDEHRVLFGGVVGDMALLPGFHHRPTPPTASEQFE